MADGAVERIIARVFSETLRTYTKTINEAYTRSILWNFIYFSIELFYAGHDLNLL